MRPKEIVARIHWISCRRHLIHAYITDAPSSIGIAFGNDYMDMVSTK